MREICAGTANSKTPSARRIAVVMDAMHSLVNNSERRAKSADQRHNVDLMRLLSKELARAVYSNFGTVYQGSTTPVDDLLLHGHLFSEGWHSLTHEVKGLNNMMDAYSDTRSSTEKTLKRCQIAAMICMKSWRGSLTYVYLKLWKEQVCGSTWRPPPT